MKMKILALLALFGSSLWLPAQTLSNYQAAVISQNPSAYFTFDNGNLTSVTNSTVTLQVIGVGGVAGGFTGGFSFDVFRDSGDSVFFTGQNDGVYDPTENSDHLLSGGGTSNLISTATGSVTLLFRTLDGPNPGQRAIFSAGGSTTNDNAFFLFVENTNAANGDPNSVKLRFGDTTTTILSSTNMTPDTWYYFAFTYNESSTISNKGQWYVGRPGGTLASGVTSNAFDAVAGDAVSFWIGNRPTDDLGFRNPGSGQVDEFAIWSRQLSPAEIQAQFGKLPNRTPAPLSAYQAIVTNQSPDYYFKFDGNFIDFISGTPVLGTYTNAFDYDWFGNPTNVAIFSGAKDAFTNSTGHLIAGGGTYTGAAGSGKGSISCLFRSLSTTNFSGQRFIFSAGGNTTVTNGFGLYFENLSSSANPGSLKVRFGNVSSTILPWTNIVTADWYYFAMSYDETQPNNQVTWWLGQPGGTLQSGIISALPGSLAGMGSLFFIGNNTNYSAGFRNGAGVNGEIDEFAIWHRLISGNEVTNEFNALTVSAGPPPILGIGFDGANVILSWPSSTSSSFALESTTNLTSPSWSSAGTPVTIGSQYVVTNTVSAGANFYRLSTQ